MMHRLGPGKAGRCLGDRKADPDRRATAPGSPPEFGAFPANPSADPSPPAAPPACNWDGWPLREPADSGRGRRSPRAVRGSDRDPRKTRWQLKAEPARTCVGWTGWSWGARLTEPLGRSNDASQSGILRLNRSCFQELVQGLAVYLEKAGRLRFVSSRVLQNMRGVPAG